MSKLLRTDISLWAKSSSHFCPYFLEFSNARYHNLEFEDRRLINGFFNRPIKMIVIVVMFNTSYSLAVFSVHWLFPGPCIRPWVKSKESHGQKTTKLKSLKINRQKWNWLTSTSYLTVWIWITQFNLKSVFLISTPSLYLYILITFITRILTALYGEKIYTKTIRRPIRIGCSS